MKKILCLIIVLAVSVSLFITAAAQDEIQILLNGKKIETDVAPQLINDRTMVPVRFIFEALGASVTWDDETSTAHGERIGIEVNMTIGEDVFYRNGKEIGLDSPAVVVNDRTLVPVRAIAESFNCKVDWDEETNSVIITTQELNVGIITDIPPFSYLSEGKIKGADIEIAVELADRMGLTPVFKVYDYNDAFEAVKKGEADLIISGLPKDEITLREVSATDSYYTSKQIIVANINSTVDPTELRGRKIGVLKDSVAEIYVNIDMDGFRVYTYDTVEDMVQALKKVDIACIVGDENTLKGKVDDFNTFSTPYELEDYVIYIQKADGELLGRLNTYLKEMKEDLTLDKILNTYIKR